MNTFFNFYGSMLTDLWKFFASYSFLSAFLVLGCFGLVINLVRLFLGRKD